MTTRAIREQHSHGEGLADAALPDIVVFPHTNEEVAAIVRAVPRRAHSRDRLRRRHVARRPRRGALRRRVPRPVADEPRARRSTTADLDCRVQAGVTREQLNAELKGTGPLLSDRSGRQCDDRRHGVDARVGHQRGSLRHDARERARPHRRHGRRPDHPHRQPRAQVERGLRPHAAVRRLGRHARHHHRGPAAAVRHSGSDLRGRVPVSRSRRAPSTR